MNTAGFGTATASVSKIKRFPRLFKKTNTGAVQYWDIFVEEKAAFATNAPAGEIVTVYGQLGTPSPQRTSDTVAYGKNAGKKNATTAFEQAEKEANAKWEKQKKKGYVESEHDARVQSVDEEFVAGGLLPMLAQSFSKHAGKIKWPCYVQPKFDGIRCIAMVRNGKATLWSRTRKPITSVPHIIEELEANFADTDVTLDGELYNHAFKSNFEEIVSIVRQEVPKDGYQQVQYHVYDMVSDKAFVDRNDDLSNLLATVNFGIIVPVQTCMANDETEVTALFTQLRGEGYEGVMLRNGETKYEQDKRSYGLQKVKEFEDAEFTIVGADEGRGKLQGHVGAFRCVAKNGVEFLAKMSGSTDKLAEYWNDSSSYLGKKLTVQYQGLTGTNDVPRFPVGLRIREEE
jgi:ATP-dependent DNA ligase